MAKLIRVMVLEDDLLTLAEVMQSLAQVEAKYPEWEYATTTLSEYTQVEDYANKTKHKFDLVLLDRDCKAGGSFHALDLSKYSPTHIIAISSVPAYNESLSQLGVTAVAGKDYRDLADFGKRLSQKIIELSGMLAVT